MDMHDRKKLIENWLNDNIFEVSRGRECIIWPFNYNQGGSPVYSGRFISWDIYSKARRQISKEERNDSRILMACGNKACVCPEHMRIICRKNSRAYFEIRTGFLHRPWRTDKDHYLNSPPS